MSTSKKHSVLAGLILLGVILVAVVTIGSGLLRQRTVHGPAAGPEIAGIYLPQARKDIQPFHLVTTNNRTFTEQDLKGHWTMMFFGFTNCGMVCPTTMAAINSMYQQLQSGLPEQALPVVVMVTVDPERDTLERLGEYVSSFNRHFIGARADIAETVALEKQLHVAAAKIQSDAGGPSHYTIDHSSDILLFNPAGELQAYLSWPHDALRMTKDYHAILARKTFSA